jgi:hypothetical protein
VPHALAGLIPVRLCISSLQSKMRLCLSRMKIGAYTHTHTHTHTHIRIGEDGMGGLVGTKYVLYTYIHTDIHTYTHIPTRS